MSTPVFAPYDDAPVFAPYDDQAELIEDYLEVVRMRLQAATEHFQKLAKNPRGDLAWPANLRAAERLIEARTKAAHAAQAEFPITWLATRFDLTTTAQLVVWLLIADELCPIARHLLRELGTERGLDPTTDVIRRVVFGHSRGLDVWSTFETLRRLDLIERTSTSQVPEHRQTWRVCRRVMALIYGDVTLDPSLADIATIDPGMPPSTASLEFGGNTVETARRAIAQDAFLIVCGRAGTGRRSLLSALVAERGATCLQVDARTIAKDLDQATLQFRALAREASLLKLTPLILNLDALEPAGDSPDRLSLVEAAFRGPVLATSCRSLARRWNRVPIFVEVGEISGAQRVSLWQRALPKIAPAEADTLATIYPLAPAFIHMAGLAISTLADKGPINEQLVARGLRVVLDDRFAGLATRMTTTQTWDDVVLPDDQVTAINELLARICRRRTVHEDWGFGEKIGKGLGVAALFSGPPGTGKTMVAGVLASSLFIEIYRVDLSKIVSKWIGETEKNLATLFDAAEAGHALLLFDEADALFGRRTEVKSSNDRHANQEVNFLLQRIESFTGNCILTSNHETAIDDAFRRRLSVHVRFEVPDVEERVKLWAAMLPARAPRAENLRFRELAESYVMSGGHIRNAVMRAAFLAADEGGVIDNRQLNRAAQLEYEAMGKIAAKRK